MPTTLLREQIEIRWSGMDQEERSPVASTADLQRRISKPQRPLRLNDPLSDHIFHALGEDVFLGNGRFHPAFEDRWKQGQANIDLAEVAFQDELLSIAHVNRNLYLTALFKACRTFGEAFVSECIGCCRSLRLTAGQIRAHVNVLAESSASKIIHDCFRSNIEDELDVDVEHYTELLKTYMLRKGVDEVASINSPMAGLVVQSILQSDATIGQTRSRWLNLQLHLRNWVDSTLMEKSRLDRKTLKRFRDGKRMQAKTIQKLVEVLNSGPERVPKIGIVDVPE